MRRRACILVLYLADMSRKKELLSEGDADSVVSEAEINREIREHLERHGCGETFIATEYRRWRLAGYSQQQLEEDYDMCHIWR